MAKKLPPEFLKRLKAVTAKRAKTVIEHLLKHGFITTEDLKDTYGYDHPPRAIRDVRELGIPLERYRVKGSHGRSIAAYRFADPAKLRANTLAGRKAFSKKFKKELIEKQGQRCAICRTKYEDRYLQIDHRIPYEVAGDAGTEHDPADYMLVCASCNRAKSWSCEHCENWTAPRDVAVCSTCYWARPDQYEHIAFRAIRRLEVIWDEADVADYDRLLAGARQAGVELPEYVKQVLKGRFKG